MENEISPLNDPRMYVAYDLFGNPYNKLYPPNKDKYGSAHEGYETTSEGVLLYDFAIMGYDVEFTYNGQSYHLLNDGEAHLTDENFSKRIKSFKDPMDLIEHLTIDGKPLISILKDLEDVEPM